MSVTITPDKAIFALLTFEGPDPYSQAGGLGTRMHNLAEALATLGYETHMFFIGDPALPGEEHLCGGKYILHRWCQWLSHHHPNGCYDGEESKVRDYNESVPRYVAEHLGHRAATEGKTLVVMAEEWHTAEALCITSDLLNWHGNRDKAVLLWNANNTMGFSNINFGRLAYVSTITTVSRFMKQLLWKYGFNAVTIHNGIPERMFNPHNAAHVEATKAALAAHHTDLAILKIGRFDPAKRWLMAAEAVARLKHNGIRTTFLVRGGIEPHGAEFFGLASYLGLSIADVTCDERRPSVEKCIQILADAPRADVLNLKFFLPEEFVNLLYHACDAVLANSGFEPFGLVGLEVMAAGGIAFTGATGEDYLIPFVNGVTVESDNPNEIVAYLKYLNDHPSAKDSIKLNAYETAKQFSWPVVINALIRRIEYLGM